MIPILSYEDTKSLDKSTVNIGNLSEKDLMNNAGRAIAQFIMEYISDPFNQKFIILAGPGNNGVDGMICHYYLLEYGANSELLLLKNNMKKSWIFEEYSIDSESINVYSNKYKFSSEYFYIDGIIGIGLNREIGEFYKTIIKEISEFPNVIAIDVPSGIYADSGMASESYIQAKYTVTMGYPKYGHYFNVGLESTGNLFVLDIGYKPLNNTENNIELIELSDATLYTPVHIKDVHKYTRGKVISLAGSEGYSGACILAVGAALKAGAGIIKVLVPKNQINIYENCLTEAISIPLEDNNSCIFMPENIEKILAEILWADAVLFGPGLKIDPITVEFMTKILQKIKKPLVLDASGFQPLIENRIEIDDLPEETILTPHYSEFCKIFNLDLKDAKENPIVAVKSIITKLKERVLILKGATNIIVTSKGKILLMDHGTSILATAGSGDVLTGVIASAIAQGLDINESAVYSTFLHAECGHQYYQNVSSLGLTASDLIEMIPYAMEEIHCVY